MLIKAASKYIYIYIYRIPTQRKFPLRCKWSLQICFCDLCHLHCLAGSDWAFTKNETFIFYHSYRKTNHIFFNATFLNVLSISYDFICTNLWLNIPQIFLRILTGKKHPKIKLQRLGRIRIWTFGLLVHQTNSF